MWYVNVCDIFSPKANHNQQRSIHCFVLLFVPRSCQYSGNHWFWSLINVRLKNAMIPCQSLHMLCCFYYYNEYKYHKNKRQARCPNKVCTCNNFWFPKAKVLDMIVISYTYYWINFLLRVIFNEEFSMTLVKSIKQSNNIFFHFRLLKCK